MEQQIQGKKIRVLELVLLLFVAFAKPLFNSFYTFFYGSLYDYQALTYKGFYFISGILTESAGIAVLVYILYRQGRSVKDIGFTFEKRDILHSVLLIIATYLIIFMFSILIYGIYPDLISKMEPNNTNFLSADLTVWYVLFVLINPIFEELIVRAYTITEVISLSNSRILALVISIFLQASYHLYQGIIPMISTLLPFTIFSVYFIKYRRAVPVIAVHFFIDLLAFARYAKF